MRPLNRTTRVPDRHPLGLAEAIPVGLAVAAFGLSFGVLAVAAGMSPFLATLSSLLVLGGGSQFAFLGVLAAGGNPMMGAVGGLLLNARYVAFGLAISRHLPPAALPRKLADSYLIVDESVGLGLTAPRGQITRRFRVVGVAVMISWIGATALGAYGGQLIGDPELFGLDAAFPAGFLALLAPWLRDRRGRVAAFVGVALALLLTPVAPPGVPIIAAGLGALVALRVAPSHPKQPDAAAGPVQPDAPRHGGPDNPGPGDEHHPLPSSLAPPRAPSPDGADTPAMVSASCHDEVRR
jgi:predicted branched-subunit amino acid permease